MLMRGSDALLSIRNFGEKSLTELLEQLEVKGFWSEEDAEASA